MRHEFELIHSTALKRRIDSLGLKQYWVAEQIGVNRRSVTRWITGDVENISPIHLRKLASCLKCDPRELIISDAADIFCNPLEINDAAQKLKKERMIEVFRPVMKWGLFEAATKLMMRPELPPPLLGEMCLDLAVACLHQNRPNEASRYAQHALKLGRRLQDSSLQCRAHLYSGQALLLSGKCNQAISDLQNSLSLSRNQDHEFVAKLHFSLASAFHLQGDFKKAILACQKGYSKCKNSKDLVTLSKSWISRGLAQLELQEYTEAQKSFQSAIILGLQANYRFGIIQARSALAITDCRRGRIKPAKKTLAKASFDLMKLGVDEPYQLQASAELALAQGDFRSAEKWIDQYEEKFQQFPFSRALSHVLRARLAQAKQDSATTRKHLQLAQRIFRQLEAQGWIALI